MIEKECPSCLADVPADALRCKHCFHDFNYVPKRKSGGMALLWSLAVMSVIAAVSMALVVQRSLEAQYYVDWTTLQIHAITTTMTGGTVSSTIPFDDVHSIEFVTGGDEKFYEVYAITNEEQRMILLASDEVNLRTFATDTQARIDARTTHDVDLVQIDTTEDL